MVDVTIQSLAKELQVSIDFLLNKLSEIGINKTTLDSLTQKEKQNLINLFHSKKSNNLDSKENVILRRRTLSTLNIQSVDGKNKTIKVEIRKKHIYKNLDKIDNNVIKNNDKEENQYLSNDLSNINNTYNKIEKETIENNTTGNNKIIEEKKDRDIENNNISDTVESQSKSEVDNIKKTHSKVSRHFREAEDDLNNKVEVDRRFKSNKLSKRKRNIYLSESRIDREESKVIRINKNRRSKSSTNIMLQEFKKPIQTVTRNIIIGETITVSELANKMAVKSSEVIKSMMQLGEMVTINQILDQETAQIVAEEMGHKVILHHDNNLENLLIADRNTKEEISIIPEKRAPIVTVMGHVDHGKTSLLDYIRSTKVVNKEYGGITQHIGAYHVKTHNGMITFLDTPGHSAFTAMRARGTKITDIIILVVAADDGVMSQTIETIQHAQLANVPIIVAINKIDKIDINIEHIKSELARYNLLSEEWGGDTQFVNISAKYGTGINDLLDAIILQSEMLGLKAKKSGIASGIVVESFLDKGKGPIATVLVREGTLQQGNIILCGLSYGKIRAMRNERGNNITSAGPSMPVEILGLSMVPDAGDEFIVVNNEKKAREVALYRQGKFREIKLAKQKKTNLENIFANFNEENNVSNLYIVIKADVKGSVEAINNALRMLSTNKIKVEIIHSGVGAITETDVALAVSTNAILLGFNVRADSTARRIIIHENIDIRYYSIIYHLVDDIKKAINGLLTPEYKEKILGLAEVRHIFRSQKSNVIAGCMVIDGIIKRQSKIRLLRNNIVIYEGELESLRRFKDNVSEVRNGMECGIGIKNYHDIHKNDKIEFFENEHIVKSNQNQGLE
ncbi:translation initiation factor IF-2 [Candidatus Schneideria nysicola]|uniref:translation initiation factor IF-2 n=1 Tax=Candidatus Schneideria nysicola TaxID=1081631 RepID=UPI001CAA778E|nr:translation initiation factor IF-2 [Candidatus Schneideria nysicola]UAJ64832.1 translation initiation factor IF-2 [Candidatus Schneideria nysicola]